MSRLLKGWMSLCLVLGIGAAGLPAEASEVVKLARLVVSGKRSTSEIPRTTTAPEPRSTSNASQAHGSASSDEAGTAPAPARGVS